MKDIRIFIASSRELVRERNELAFLVLAYEEEFAARGLRVRLAKWEYVDPRMTEARTEDRYLDEMYDCDAAFVLFRNIAGMYTREELDKALAREREGTTRLKAHAILFAADGKPGSDAARLRESLPPDSYGTWSDREELRAAFMNLVERVAGMDLREVPSDKYVRRITAFLAADEELADERNAFADTVLNVNDLLEQAHRNIRVQLRFYNPGNAESVLESSEMGLVLYGTNYRVFGRKEIEDIHSRVKDGSRNPKRFYVFFRELDEAAEKSLDETFKAFRSDFVTKLGHFTCEFGDANALRLGFLLSLERYAGESIEIYSTVSAPTTPVFVGREKELRKLHDLLEPVLGKFPAGRLPVITGAGGTGKSELVRQYASQLRVQYPGGLFQIDMERVKTWDEAFLGILNGIPNNGVKIKDYLELESGKADGMKSGGSETITGEMVRDALLKKARYSGPMLLVLDNVEGCMPLLGRDGGFAKAFPSGFSERVVVNVVATARVCDAMLRPGDWAVPFPLGDLSPDDALALMLGDQSGVDAAERAAAGRVAELLGYRALYLRRVPALIGDLYAETVCDSYAELANALEENLLGTVAEETEGTHLPDVLWTMTRERLLKMPLGPECVKLAQVASFFSPDGFPKHILMHLWKTVVAPNQDDRKFARAVEILKHHNIFQTIEPVRIHRLDRAAIMQNAKAQPGLENAVGKSLASYDAMCSEDWLLVSENTAIIGFVPTDILEYRSLACSPSLQAKLLSINPAFIDYCQRCSFSGCDWSIVLQRQPQFADFCKWEMLCGSDLADLLKSQPQFSSHCSWGKLDGDDWVTLLGTQPQFSIFCIWGKLSGANWAYLLTHQPQFADYCVWEKLDGECWAYLISIQPRFSDRCPWELLHGKDWAAILQKQIGFGDQCPWETLNGSDWVELLGVQPQFADSVTWKKLSGSNWAQLLIKRPQFADCCPWDIFTGGDWVSLLKEQPQFSNYCRWEIINGEEWAELLGIQPQFAKYCAWEILDGSNWASLLETQPQFGIKCPWEKLRGKGWAWVRLLSEQPEFSDFCFWEDLEGEHWVALLSRQPQYAGRCPWAKLNGEHWARLLGFQPRFYKYCDWDKFTGENWVGVFGLLTKRPQFADFCSFSSFSGWEWTMLLCTQPQFANLCPWQTIDNWCWSFLLGMQPQFASHCPWETFDGENWVELLSYQPQFSNRCAWAKLCGDDWTKLLSSQPQFSDFCEWVKLNGDNWVDLLGNQPQFADHCDWNELNGEDWSHLLAHKPNFAKYCQWSKLTIGDWQSLLIVQPRFARQCSFEAWDNEELEWVLYQQPEFRFHVPCDNLDGSKWVALLRYWPMLADSCPWGKLNFDKVKGWEWVSLLSKSPQFADYCEWEKLNDDNWTSLLMEQPQLASFRQLSEKQKIRLV